MARSNALWKVTAAGACFLASAANASDGDILFFDKNHCAKPYGRWFDSEVAVTANCKYNKLCPNDYFRSVWIAPTVKPGTRIKVWDSPDGSHKDDWAEIVVKKVTSNFQGSARGRHGMCIDSFEAIRSGSDYSISYRRENGLDGKVSMVRITPAR